MIKKYCQISMDDLIFNKPLEMDIFVRLHDQKFVRIAKLGEKMDQDRKERYQKKGVKFFFVKRKDYPKILDFNISMTKAVVHNSQIDIEKKKKFMAQASEIILENTFVVGLDHDAFHHAKDFLLTCMDMLTEDKEVIGLLEALNAQSDYLYAHSLGVSMYSVMIAKAMGWSTTSNLFKLSFSGLMHDIGKTKIDRKLLEKPKSELNFSEKVKYESHTRLGRNILANLRCCPNEAVSVAYEHHESCIEEGFPRRLKASQIHPMARIIRVSDEFCYYALKGPESPGRSAFKAFHMIEQYKKHHLDEDFYLALKSLIRKVDTKSQAS